MSDLMLAIQTAATVVEKLSSLSQKAKVAEFQTYLADLAEQLANAKIEAARLKEQVADLMNDNRGLRDRLQQKESEKPTVVDGAYAFVADDGRYCTGCFDVHQRKVLLTQLRPPFNEAARWQCPVCHALLG